MLGADVEELRALARDFSGKSQSLLQVKATLDGAVNQLPRYWQGPDAQRFAAQWRGSQSGVIARTAAMLNTTATELNKNALEQEQASAVSGAGGPGGAGGGGASNPWGPDWLAKDSHFRDNWKHYGSVKNVASLPKNLWGLGWMGASKNWDFFTDSAQWAKLTGRSAPFNIMDSTTDLLGMKNLNKYFPQLNSMKGFFAESSVLFKGSKLDWLGKGGLGRGLGWLGVGLSGYDTVKNIAEGDVGGASYSFAKTALGVACFLPPPAGTVAQVVSAGWAIYEIPAVKEFVDGGVKAVGDAVSNAAQSAVAETAKFANSVNEGIKDLGNSAAKFLGFG